MGEKPRRRDFATMPVTGIIDHILTIIPDNVQDYMGFHSALKRIRDGIFIELPESRTELLVEVGRVVNRYAKPISRFGDSVPLYWHDVRDVMMECFEAQMKSNHKGSYDERIGKADKRNRR